MPRAVSIHIGVNHPHGPMSDQPLTTPEVVAWRMAEVASQAGYGSTLVLRGEAATRQAVHDALTGAAGILARDDILFVSFCGHGAQERDMDCDEGHGWDEGWCLKDGHLVDDKLGGYWSLFDAGVRILVVSESCYAGGVGRTGEEADAPPPGPKPAPVMRGAPFVPPVVAPPGVGGGAGIAYRRRAARSAAAAVNGTHMRSARTASFAGSCIASAPSDSHGVRASLLLLAASHEDRPASEGMFSESLLRVWDGGAFRGSYCDLHRQVRDLVMTNGSRQDPQILMMGAPDPAFPLETAFHLEPRVPGKAVTYRG
jgi:hypothetical protein